jgi:hypothetical protein
MIHGIGFMLLVGGLVGVRSSGVISGERERQCWVSLLLTPLEPKQLIRGKLWGIIDSARPYLLAYLLPVLLCALGMGILPVLCILYCWFAAWGLLYFQGANGVYWSARSASSWQSLLKTGTTGGWAVFYRLFLVGVLAMPVVSCLSFFSPFGMRPFLVLVVFVTPVIVTLFARAEYLLQEAEKHVAREERTQQKRHRIDVRSAVSQ